MFRVIKALNHNGILAINMENHKEYILLGKGIGFQKKVNERIEASDNARIYLLQQETGRGLAKEIINNIEPQILEITNNIILEAEKKFQKVDENILCPLADHIAFAVKRIKNNEQISNPLTQDIKALFPEEYEVACKGKDIIKEIEGIEINDDEIGYIALHIHSSLGNEKVSQAMEIAMLVRSCITSIEESTGKKIDIESLSYNRLMNHIKYMAARLLKGETIKLDMNDYISERFPKSFEIAEYICKKLGRELKKEVKPVEIGYLAMHIERVFSDELEE
ncbi:MULTISPECIES: PRD domain-containing protein [unclassified Clostridium]|uniref:PRD domain-containing protein n=1 Tax=unclassified Clostridium TaxID=2614128 RepID=UPI00029866BB|nr:MULTISPECIES: PRD domain-containing protein [unclassified Clostridium]EKQ55517.1 MAG: transcriptional antiterminator [Clostridium sp. Maddingley MBC34-26]